MGPERHGRVRGYGFGPTPTSIFGSTSRRRSGVILSTQLENAQEMLIAAEQKFTTTTEELSNVKNELSHVKETFEERLIEIQRKTREKVKKKVTGKMIENAKTNANITSRTYDVDDATMSIKAIELWRLCYIFIW